MAKSRGDRGAHYDALVLLSGGPDSATLLYNVIKQEKKKPLALHLSTGLGPNTKEFVAAKSIAETAGAPLQVIDISHFISACGGAMPTIHSEAHVLRFGTAVVLSMATAFAIQNQIPTVWVALHEEDAAEATEYSSEFLDFMNSGVSLIGESCTIKAPFHNWTKAKILALARKLEVPVDRTWSCVSPIKGKQCGVCGACRARRAAFAKSSIEDKTKYGYK